jgi:hypothetical protein
MSPEQKARVSIDALLVQAGWRGCNVADAVSPPPLAEQARIFAEVDRHLSIIREVESGVDANLQRAQVLRQATRSRASKT